MNPDTPISDEYKASNPLVADLLSKVGDVKYQYQSIDAISYTTAVDALTPLYAQLADGTLSPEDMCKKLDEAAEKDANYGK